MPSPDTITFHAASESETDQLAAALAAHLQPGDVVALDGPLGAGKTRFVQGVAKALGCGDQFVNSPTFILVQEYEGPFPIYHVDAYRLRDADEFLELGGDELLGGEGAVFIEWAERIAEVLPRDVLRIGMQPTGATSRRFDVEAMGPRSHDSLMWLANTCR